MPQPDSKPDPSPAAGLPPRPQPPRDSDCCRSDCPICVFDLYERELERWKEQVEAIRQGRTDGGA